MPWHLHLASGSSGVVDIFGGHQGLHAVILPDCVDASPPGTDHGTSSSLITVITTMCPANAVLK